VPGARVVVAILEQLQPDRRQRVEQRRGPSDRVGAGEERLDLDLRGDAIRRAAPLLDTLSAIGLQLFEDRDDDTRTGHDALPLLARLFASATYRGLRALDIHQPEVVVYPDRETAYPSGHGNEVAELVVRTRAHASLRAFGIRGSELGARGVEALRAGGVFANLERLWLYEATLTSEDIRQVVTAAPRLRGLGLGPTLEPAAIAALPAGLRELDLRQRTTDGLLDALAASPVAASLERLALGRGMLDANAHLLARFPRLRALDLHEVAFGSWRSPAGQTAALRRFLDAPPPALRELRGGVPATTHDALALADALGPRLEHLDLRGVRQVSALAPELAARVAGEVLVGEAVWEPRLLHADPAGPDHASVDLR